MFFLLGKGVRGRYGVELLEADRHGRRQVGRHTGFLLQTTPGWEMVAGAWVCWNTGRHRRASQPLP